MNIHNDKCYADIRALAVHMVLECSGVCSRQSGSCQRLCAVFNQSRCYVPSFCYLLVQSNSCFLSQVSFLANQNTCKLRLLVNFYEIQNKKYVKYLLTLS